jgi:hypothetical protein
MTVRRVVLLVTGLVVATLGVVFAVTQWDRVDRIATVVSALGAVAAVGVAVWAALPAGRGSSVRVSNTGKATAEGNAESTTGLSASAGSLPHQVEIENTGDAEASDGSGATSGLRLD